MMNIRKRAAALLLAVTMIVQSAANAGSFLAAAAESTEEQHQPGMGYIHNDMVVDAPRGSGFEQLLHAAELPSKYDLRDYGRVTSVKQQGSYGTCWTFSSLACIESNLITRGYADSTIDLSEKHLAYYTYKNVADKLGNTAGDYIEVPGKDYLSAGGNSWIVANTLANWEGIALEQDMPYDTPATYDPTAVYPDADAYGLARYHIDNVYFVPGSSRDIIKQKIMELGACDAAVYYSDAYINPQTHAYCAVNQLFTNHAVVIVGWDDSYSRDNFPSSCAPQNDGAWLARNSWGSEWAYGDSGYFWISYEDSALCSPLNEVTFYEASPVGSDYNIYQYDGSAYQRYASDNQGMKMANIYTAASDREVLTSVGFYTMQSDIAYTIDVYTGVDRVPDDGTAAFASAQTGTTGASGYYTVALNEPVELMKGEKFSIIITLDAPGDDEAYYLFDSTNTLFTLKQYSTAHAGQSFFGFDGYEWSDLTETDSTGVFRIKGITEKKVHPMTLPHAASGITVTTDEKETEVTEDTELTVSTPAFNEQESAAVTSISTVYTAYDIALTDGGKITPSEDITVTIPVPDGYTPAYTALYRLAPDGTLTKVEASVNDGAYEYKTKLTGVYILFNTAPGRLPGDVDADGEVDMQDSTVLRRWLANWFGVTITAPNADVNADGEVNLQDSTILRRYFADWSGVELV